MLQAKIRSKSDIDTTAELFHQWSISLDNSKFLRHKHITARPKLKRLLKLKSCSTSIPINNAANSFCTRCKKETLLGDHVSEQQSSSEKEVEVVKKEFGIKSLWEKKVHFLVDGFGTLLTGEKEEKADEKKAESVTENHDGFGVKVKDTRLEKRDNNRALVSVSLPEQECTLPQFQSVSFARRPSIVGNNEFWLPQYSSSDIIYAKKEDSIVVTKPATKIKSQEVEEEGESGAVAVENTTSCIEAQASSKDDDELDLNNASLVSALSVVLNGIFKQGLKRQVKILQVTTLFNHTLLALTEEYMFHCQNSGKGYEIIDVVCLKDVGKIMVSDSCVVLVLEVHHSSSLTEFKEFVPGFSEKTESLISLMVFALSRIKKLLPDVTRLPLLSLPTCDVMKKWLTTQNEEIKYVGLVEAENISEPDYEVLKDDKFMMNIANVNQFHPVTLLVRSGYLTTKCNGGCTSGGCKYSMTLGLEKEKVTGMRREDKPWPNCVRLLTTCMDITFAGISKASADDLMEKLYSSSQPFYKDSMKLQVFVLITQTYLQLFKMTLNKIPLFGSPLLNLEIFDEVLDGTTCVIDMQGVEVVDHENLQVQNRWHLTFPNKTEKFRFLSSATISD